MSSELETVLQELVDAAYNPWVSKSGYARALEVSEGVIETWMRRWTKDIEYKVIGRTTLIHRERANEWIGQQGLDPEDEGLKSPSGRGKSGSTTRSYQATHIAQLTSPVQ